MSGTIGKSLRLSSPLKVEEEEGGKVSEKQGIVSILGSDCERTKAASLRRTLSADMSSKKWLAQHGFSFSPMKKIASSEELAISVAADSSSTSEEEEEEYQGKKPGQADVWRSIQSQIKKTGQVDTWISILSNKTMNKEEGEEGEEEEDSSSKLQPPYVHPLVKKSSSSLSEKSLQICTESLGSETGSDGFSSYAPSETDDVEEDKEQTQEEKELQFVKCNYSTCSKKLSPRSFPRPLPSLARPDGPSLHMQFHRENGRLVLEAVSLPSTNCFRAQRQDGRLLLTFANSNTNSPPSQEPNCEALIDQEEDQVLEEIEEVFNNFEEEQDYETEEEDEEETEEEENEKEMVEKVENKSGGKEIGILMEQAPKLSSGVINVHRSALVMKKLMGLDNRNQTWTHKFNKAINLVEEKEGEPIPTLPHSLPQLIPSRASPPGATAAATSLNAYDYLWRTKPTAATVATMNMINPITHQCPALKNKLIPSNGTPKAYQQQEMNKANYMFTLLRRGCKEPKRSLSIWEPYCVATS